MVSKIFSACFLSALISTVAGHGALTLVTGANGVTSPGFGILASTPRNGASPNPFEQDTSVIRANEIQSGKAQACGRTKAGGVNDVATQMEAAVSAGLPSAGADGSVTMTLHQVNQDGAGPYTCEVDATGTGNSFQAMQVTQNVPGFLGLSLATAKDFQLVAQMPAGTTCAGGSAGNACLVRCKNQAIAGPFGGCAAVTNADAAAPAAGAAAAGAAAPAAAAPAAAAPADGAAGAAGGLAGKLGGLGAGGAAGAAGGIAGKLGGAGGAGGIAGKLGGLLGLGARNTDDEQLDFDHSENVNSEADRRRWVKSRIVGTKRAWAWL